MLFKHLHILLSFFSVPTAIVLSCIFQVPYLFFPKESFSTLLSCLASIRLSLSAPDNTAVLPSYSSKSLNICSNLILLLLYLNHFSENLLWDKI